jgi:predicted aspartyl protease
MTAPVRINDQGPFDFVVDTGANRTVVSAELARILKLPAGPPAQVHGVAGVEPASTAVISEFQIGSATTRGLTAPCLGRDRLGTDGLIGVDVLRGRRAILDFRRGRLLIGAQVASQPTAFQLRRDSAAGRSDLGRRIVVPARYRFGQLIIIGADVDRRRVTAFLDSGSQSTVGNSALARLVDSGRLAPRAVRYGVPVLSATGQTAHGELGVTPLLRIGGLTISDMTTVFADLHIFSIWDLVKQPSLMIGVDLLRQFDAVELDYPRREVAFYLKGG